MVMLLIAMSEPFAWIVAVDQIPNSCSTDFRLDHITLVDSAPYQHLFTDPRDSLETALPWSLLYPCWRRLREHWGSIRCTWESSSA